MSQDKNTLITNLHELGVIQFGEFILKSGETSPIYLDLRLLVDSPPVLRTVAEALHAHITNLQFDKLAAIPLAGMPIGVALSLASDIPLIYPRMAQKKHGTKKTVEGSYNPGDTVLVVDDVISSGDSKIEALDILRDAGLQVTDMLVIVDREMGGAEILKQHGCTVHHLLTLPDILKTLLDLDRINQTQFDTVTSWLSGEKG